MRTGGGGARLVVGVVPRGEADRQVGAAIRAGAQAVTVFVGRGYGPEQEVGASGLVVRAEKEVILTVVGPEFAGPVVRAMADASNEVYGPSDHIATMPVAEVIGLLEATREERG